MKILKLISLFFLAYSTFADTHTVENILDNGIGSLRYVINNSQTNDIIEFSLTLTNQGHSTIVLNSEIDIPHTLIIKGVNNENNSIIISGNNTNRIFSITGIAKLTLNDLILTNGFSNNNGGAILLLDKSSVELDNCIISNCTADYGGAISSLNTNYSSTNTAVQITIKNSYLHHNTAIINGGSINTYSNKSFSSTNSDDKYLTKSIVYLDHSTIANNKAGIKGGGICLTSFASADISNIYHSLLVKTLTNCVINTSTFYNNYAPEGSSISLSSSPLIIVKLKKATGSVDGLLYLDIINSTIKGLDSLQNSEIYCDTKIYNFGYRTHGKDTIRIHNSIISSPASSSILMHKNSNGNNIIYDAATLKQSGNNIFSDAIQLGSTSTDQLNATKSDINFNTFENHGGNTPTVSFNFPSIAHNNGDPLVNSNAQNSPIYNTRDIGSYETCNTYTTEQITTFNSYEWIDGNTYTTTDSNIIYTTTNANNCKEINHLNLEILNGDNLSLYPNPILGSSVLNLVYNSPNTKKHQISILNTSGHVIQTFTNTGKIGINRILLDINKTESGIYILHIDGLNLKSKFVVYE